MKKILYMVIFLLSLMVCWISPAWAGGLDDLKAGHKKDDKRKYDEAIALYTKAIESGELSRDDLEDAYDSRGFDWYHIKDDYDKAIADYTKFIELDPKDARAYDDRGNAWDKKGDYDKAIADYTKAIELDPKDARAYDDRAKA